jgi:hypothetical protein
MKNGKSFRPAVAAGAPPQGAPPMQPSPEMVRLGDALHEAHRELIASLDERFSGEKRSGTDDPGWADRTMLAIEEAHAAFKKAEAAVAAVVEAANARARAQHVAPSVATEEQIASAVLAAKEALRAVIENPGNGAQWLQLGWTLVLMPDISEGNVDPSGFRLTAKLVEEREAEERDFSYLGRVCKALGVPHDVISAAVVETPELGVYSFRWMVAEQLISKGGSA